MSRIGKKLITLPSDVEMTISGAHISVKGPKGALQLDLHPHVAIIKDGQNVTLTVKNETDVSDRALWGLFGALITNMLVGVTKGFEKKLEINGVGYKVALQGNALKFDLGFSHPIVFSIPSGISATVEKNLITVSGIDKQLVGETAARIRRLRPPEPYKGKGIKYLEETIRRKAGKAAKTAAK